MFKCISKVFSWIPNLWRTLVSTFVKKHLYHKDIDNDGQDEIVIDLNGNSNYDHLNKEVKEDDK